MINKITVKVLLHPCMPNKLLLIELLITSTLYALYAVMQNSIVSRISLQSTILKKRRNTIKIRVKGLLTVKVMVTNLI